MVLGVRPVCPAAAVCILSMLPTGGTLQYVGINRYEYCKVFELYVRISYHGKLGRKWYWLDIFLKLDTNNLVEVGCLYYRRILQKRDKIRSEFHIHRQNINLHGPGYCKSYASSSIVYTQEKHLSMSGTYDISNHPVSLSMKSIYFNWSFISLV